MTIDEMSIYVFDLPGNGAISKSKWTCTSHYLIRIRNKHGITGIGEGTPYQGGLCENLVLFKKIRNHLIGRNFDDARRILTSIQIQHENSAGFDYGIFLAIDSALLHFASNISEGSLIDCFDVRHHSFPAIGTIFLLSDYERLKKTKYWIRKGVMHLKVKISGSYERDIGLLESISDAIPRSVDIRVDANGAFRSLNEAINTLKELENYGVVEVEQPFPKGNLTSTRKLCDKIDMKIFLDEEVDTPSMIARIHDMGACHGIHIHPSRYGTLVRTKQIINIIQNYGLEWSLGSNGFTALGTLIHLLLLSEIDDRASLVEEVGHFEQFGCDIVNNPFEIRNGLIEIPKNLGGCYTVNKEQIDRYAKPIWETKRILLSFGKCPLKRIISPILMKRMTFSHRPALWKKSMT